MRKIRMRVCVCFLILGCCLLCTGHEGPHWILRSHGPPRTSRSKRSSRSSWSTCLRYCNSCTHTQSTTNYGLKLIIYCSHVLPTFHMSTLCILQVSIWLGKRERRVFQVHQVPVTVIPVLERGMHLLEATHNGVSPIKSLQ